MTATPAATVTRQAQDYLAAVEHELADLPAEDRNALLEDLAQHLDALAAEDDERPVAVRLGPPAEYAVDLRAAAGLPARGSAVRPAAPGLRERLDAVLAAAAPAAREVRRLLGELRPAWWVLRGYLLVLAPCLLARDGVSDFPVPAPLGSHAVGLLLVVAAVTDVFPYAADGTPVEGVLLYDQDGRPLHVGYQEWWADECVRMLDQPQAADGVPVPNSFPQSYELLTALDVDIHGAPLTTGQCAAELPRPDVPLP